MDTKTLQNAHGASITFPSLGNNRVARFNYRAGDANEVWLRHNFGSYPGLGTQSVDELWLNVQYLVNDTAIYNPNPGQASKILYFNWSDTKDETRTFQVVLSAVDNGDGHRFRLSKEVFNEAGHWIPGGQWLGNYAPTPIPENQKISLQLHIRNSTRGEANGLVQLYHNGKLIIEQQNIALNDRRGHSPNALVLTPQISHSIGSGADGYTLYDNVALYNTDPGLFTAD
jgi:hypothetical protein